MLSLKRLSVIVLILVAFARLTWALDGKNLWWDESLSLQRAEADLWTLIRGLLVIYDGFTSLPTTDQHPFLSFLLQGILVRLAGSSEFVLRFISVMAATLLVPLVYAVGYLFAKRDLLPATTPYWAALMATVSPFFLWYGQEARPYALWAFLALLSTYLLLQAIDDRDKQKKTRFLPYAIVLALMMTTHYFSPFLLPVHALLLYLHLYPRNPRLAITAAGLLLGIGMLIGGTVAWQILSRGGGINFKSIELSILLPDLLNAFSMGLSMNINTVWWLDILYGCVALIGILFSLRSWRALANRGWVLGAMIVIPIGVLWLINLFQPAYMNARHMSLIGGGYLLALGGGLGLLWHYQKWLTGLLVAVMIAGAGYSTVNYFTQEESAKDDYTSLGQHMDDRIMPGDVILLRPPFSWRIFHYYLPIDEIDQANQAGFDVAHYGMPLLHGGWEATFSQLEAFTKKYRRIWLITSGTHPYLDLDDEVGTWLDEHTYRLQEITFFSRSSLKARLYLPVVPVFNEPLQTIEQPLAVTYGVPEGDQIQLIGYHVGAWGAEGIAMPVTLYWQTLRDTDVRYKYILQLVELAPDGAQHVVATTEREPYDGMISTNLWAPGQTIREYSEIPPVDWAMISPERHRLRLQIYHTDTLEKLPITNSQDLRDGAQIDPDGLTLWIPLVESDHR